MTIRKQYIPTYIWVVVKILRWNICKYFHDSNMVQNGVYHVHQACGGIIEKWPLFRLMHSKVVQISLLKQLQKICKQKKSWAS